MLALALLAPSPRFPCGLQLGFYHAAARQPLRSAPSATDASLSRGPRRRKELVVSQVLLILIGSGMTYCQGEGDGHGPTGMGAGGMQGMERRHLCMCNRCASLLRSLKKKELYPN